MSVVLKVTQLGLTAGQLGVCAVPVVVVVHAAVVDHGRDERVLVIVRAVVVAVSVHDDGEALEEVTVAEHRTTHHSVLGVPDGKAVAKQLLALSVHLEVNVQFPVAYVARLKFHDGIF